MGFTTINLALGIGVDECGNALDPLLADSGKGIHGEEHVVGSLAANSVGVLVLVIVPARSFDEVNDLVECLLQTVGVLITVGQNFWGDGKAGGDLLDEFLAITIPEVVTPSKGVSTIEHLGLGTVHDIADEVDLGLVELEVREDLALLNDGLLREGIPCPIVGDEAGKEANGHDKSAGGTTESITLEKGSLRVDEWSERLKSHLQGGVGGVNAGF